jgi:hypothetical protein
MKTRSWCASTPRDAECRYTHIYVLAAMPAVTAQGNSNCRRRIFLQQARDDLHDPPKAFHLFLDGASHTSTRKAYRVAYIYRLSGLARK